MSEVTTSSWETPFFLMDSQLMYGAGMTRLSSPALTMRAKVRSPAILSLTTSTPQ